jgi:4-hydroxythreonine-4-phosphate dehydrogenase
MNFGGEVGHPLNSACLKVFLSDLCDSAVSPFEIEKTAAYVQQSGVSEATTSRVPVVAVSMGDPGSIAPEVLVKALADASLRERAKFHVHGIAACLEAAAARAGIEPFWSRASAEAGFGVPGNVVVFERPLPQGRSDGVFPAQPDMFSGELSFRFVEDAIADAQLGEGDPRRADAICTGPINKQAWALAGHSKYPGHTELLKDRFHAEKVAMFFHVPPLEAEESAGRPVYVPFNVILATVHIPLMKVRGTLTIGRLFEVIKIGHEGCVRLGLEKPRIAVCGLNPHAGEGGLLGDEEERFVTPAIEVACESGLDVQGPYPGDTVFNAAAAGKFDLVVAMYHDQGLIPVKLLARDRAVNCTLGLPVIRTSPDHGTAFDIAGKNVADPGSMRSALELAVRMARTGRNGQPA